MRTLRTSAGLVAMLLTLTGRSLFAADEPKWESLLSVIDPNQHTVAGTWEKSKSELTVSAAQGARLWIPVAPTGEYDVRLEFTRRTGVHSIALFFPRGKGQASFEVDAWGQHLAGIQNIDGRDIRQNASRKENVTLTNGTRYTMIIEVRRGQIRTLLDDDVIATIKTNGDNLTVPDLWALPHRQTLGIGAWDSETVFHKIEARQRDGKPIPRFDAGKPAARTAATTPAPTTPSTPAAKSLDGKRVLIVIANQDFFYREYAEPRAELERAGAKVTVAAGRKSPCRPHGGSGQGNGDGVVQPDLALADVRSKDYDAILFSGGWGSSCYQFAFTGRYNTPAYNGERAVKAKVNQLIGEFLVQEKYVCALCNAVSVLAWARVDGESPLKGKTVCAPTRQAAAGIYNGQPAQPSCRWHPEVNGAVLSPAGAIGRPGTAEDDVVVDGLIVTGEDDISARQMGRVMVELLSK